MIDTITFKIRKDNLFDMQKAKWSVLEGLHLLKEWKSSIIDHFMKKQTSTLMCQEIMKMRFKCYQKIWERLISSQQEILGHIY